MPNTAFGMPGYSSLYDPSIAVDQATLDRQMALAQALRQQSMTPVDTNNRQIGGVGYRVSPLEGIAKALQAYKANTINQDNDQLRLALTQKTAAAMGPMLANILGEGGGTSPVSDPNGGRPAGVSADAMTQGGFPQPPAQPQQTDTQGAKIKRAAMSAMMMGNTDLANKLISNYLELTPEQKNMAAKGIDPIEMGKAELGKAQKEATAPTRLGPSAYADARGNLFGLPSNILGAINVRDPNAPGGWRSVQQEGANANIKSAETSKTLGAKPGYSVTGAPLPYDTTVPPQVQAGRDVDRAAILRKELATVSALPDSKEKADNIAALNKELGALPPAAQGGGVYAEPPLGAVAAADSGAKNRQNVMKEDYTNLSNQNSTAQTMIARLQTIKTLGPKALTGGSLEQRDFMNGLLSLAGVKGAEDAKTAGDLLDKNAAQIALTIGGGAQATDALRSLAQIANPSRHMTDPAMQQAADSLIAPLQMTQDKTQLLTPHFTSGDQNTYFAKKQAFEKNADYRLWEMRNLPANAQAAYVNALNPADAKALLDKRSRLKQLGLFQ